MKNVDLDPKVLFVRATFSIFKMDLLALEANSVNSYNGS